MNRGQGPSLDGLLEGVGGFGANTAELAVLQAKLAAADLREAGGRIQPALIAAAVLAPLAGATATTALLALGYWLAGALRLPLPQALGLTALAGAVACGLLALLAWWRLRAGMVAFRRSREELERNVAWLGTVLTQSGR